jgi:non-specific serine/threonine protein kinase
VQEHLPRIGAEVAGYRLESLISRGGMAVVYLAEDIRLGRKVAVKILAIELAEDDTFRERFLRESRIATSIDHPNVIPIYDAGDDEGLLYIAMRRVEDADLRELLRAEGPLEIDRAVAIASQIASALDSAHQRGLVHRDVKPANVLILVRRAPGSFDHVYLSDFGLAKRVRSVSGITSTGQFLGTVNYTAPEQIEGADVDARTDIYALGCVLFECLTGRPPFRKEEDLAVVMAHLHEEAAPVTDERPDCPPALADAIAKMLAKDPEERFQTCDELIDALAAASAIPMERVAPTYVADAGDDGPMEPPQPPQAAAAEQDELSEADGEPPRRRLSAAAIGVAGVLLGALVAVAIFLLAGSGDDEDPAAPGPAEPAAETTAPETQVGSGPDVGRWRPVQDAPTTRQQAASVVSGGRIWVLGGLKGTGTATATKKVQTYDPAIDTWSGGPELPDRLHHAMAVELDGEIVVIGGWVPRGSNLTAQTSSAVYALRDGEWTELPSLNTPRAAGAAAVVGDEIVVVGGQNDGELVASTEIFDGESWREGAAISTPREHLGAASDGSYVYAVGGRKLSSDRNSGALERYDPSADRWERLPSMPTATGSVAATIIGEHLVVVGGEETTGVLDHVQAFDLGSEEWSELPPIPEPVHGMSIGAVADTLYVLGGAGGPGHVDSSSSAQALHFR